MVNKDYLIDYLKKINRERRFVPEYIKALKLDHGNKKPNLSFYSDEQTVSMIVHERKSLSRFGDGELIWMFGNSPTEGFQKNSEKLTSELRRVFSSANSDLLIGIPIGICNSKKCLLGVKMHWRAVRVRFIEAIEKFGLKDRCYANASITRPYIDYHDREYSAGCFQNLRRIWDGKDIIFVEGSKTKLGMGNDLFHNANSIQRIICPAENAFERIDEIKQSICNNVDKSKLILAALGPTATILASDLCDAGYQVIDIGHIDNEYIWFIRHDIIRKPIEGKYVNEVEERSPSDLYENDEEYLSSIIDKVL